MSTLENEISNDNVLVSTEEENNQQVPPEETEESDDENNDQMNELISKMQEMFEEEESEEELIVTIIAKLFSFLQKSYESTKDKITNHTSILSYLSVIEEKKIENKLPFIINKIYTRTSKDIKRITECNKEIFNVVEEKNGKKELQTFIPGINLLEIYENIDEQDQHQFWKLFFTLIYAVLKYKKLILKKENENLITSDKKEDKKDEEFTKLFKDFEKFLIENELIDLYSNLKLSESDVTTPKYNKLIKPDTIKNCIKQFRKITDGKVSETFNSTLDSLTELCGKEFEDFEIDGNINTRVENIMTKISDSVNKSKEGEKIEKNKDVLSKDLMAILGTFGINSDLNKMEKYISGGKCDIMKFFKDIKMSDDLAKQFGVTPKVMKKINVILQMFSK